MAATKISALTAITALADGDLFVVDDVSDTAQAASGSTRKIVASDVAAYMLAELQLLGMSQVKSLASDATANSTTTAAKITGLDLAVGVGIWTFQYFIRYVTSITTTGVKFSVNHTGTLTAFVANMSYVDAAATASTGAASQAANASTAQVMGAYSARAKSTAAGMGPTLSADSTGDMLMVVEGLLICTVAGNIELYHASETAASTTIKAGTSLILNKTG